MFVDRVRIWARAGKGGAGCSSFRREKFVPKGGPDGGDGGKGGDIILRVNPHINNLVHLKYKPHQFADNGRNGQGKKKTGKSGGQHIIEVPPGTCVYRLFFDENNFDLPADLEDHELVADLTTPDTPFTLCQGGRGGLGNSHFKSSVNQTPTHHQEGEEGEKGQFLMELKSIADAGLVGFPNAGKSSLISILSSAHPKIAPYPFTTLSPVIGTIELEDYSRITMADIPGLIEGAHEGVGLGHDFLRHIERCKVLVFVLDMAGIDNRHPAEDFHQLRKEINLYQKELSERPYLIVANKMDLPQASTFLEECLPQLPKKPISISTETGEGLETLTRQLSEIVQGPTLA